MTNDVQSGMKLIHHKFRQLDLLFSNFGVYYEKHSTNIKN